jgi:Golgi apparatus protein 1
MKFERKHPSTSIANARRRSTEPSGSAPVIKGPSMKTTIRFSAKLGLLPMLAVLSVGSAQAQTNIGKLVLEKLTARIEKVEKACATDIKKYCRTVTPGEGRMIYCLQAHEDKISAKCAFELEETATNVQISADALKDAVIACKAEINGVCGKILPGNGRIAACLIENRSAASTGCAEAIRKVEAMAAQ